MKAGFTILLLEREKGREAKNSAAREAEQYGSAAFSNQ